MNDTPPHVAARYHAMLMRLNPGERLAMSCRMFGAAKTVALAGARMSHGALNPAALRREVFRRFRANDVSPADAQRVLAHITRHELSPSTPAIFCYNPRRKAVRFRATGKGESKSHGHDDP